MAANLKQGHTRADSAVDGIHSMSEALTTAQSLCTAISSFASESGVRTLYELVQIVPQLENDIKHLNAELATREEHHNSYNKEQLGHFEERYDEWKDEATALRNKIKELQAASKEKDTEMTTLRGELKDYIARVNDLEKEHSQMTNRLKERNQQIGDLGARLQNTQADANDCSEKLRESYNQVIVLERSLKDEKSENNSLKEEAAKTKERLRELILFSVKVKDLNLSEVANQLEGSWKSATVLMETFFRQDLSEDILQNDWTRLRENDVFKHQIPLPQSNSDIAKQMRVAIILGALARLVDKFIFQPTYLLHEESGLRELLCRQAAINQRKERFTRGIILSMFPEEQETNSKDGVDFVVEELLDTMNVRILLASDTLATFERELEEIITRIQGEWKNVQRGKQKLEPNFTYSTSTSRPWHIFNMQVADGKSKHPGHPLTTNDVEDNIVIFPRVYLMETEAEPDPITHGSVLQRAQLDAAAEEVRKSLSSAPFAQPTSSRHRNRPSRTMSMTGDGSRGGRRDERFLS